MVQDMEDLLENNYYKLKYNKELVIHVHSVQKIKLLDKLQEYGNVRVVESKWQVEVIH